MLIVLVAVGTIVYANDKVTICHATGSVKNPYVVITVSANGLNGHSYHANDVIPMPATGCPGAGGGPEI